MKRYFFTALMSVAASASAGTVPQLIANYGTVTNPSLIQLEGTAFFNQGTIAIDTVTVNSNFVYPIGDNAGNSSLPFSTRDTLYYTNTSSGVMAGTNGFDFETITATTVHPASDFVNDGFIFGFDYPASPDTYSTTAGTTAIPAGSVPVSAHVNVAATNVLNDGMISVGNAGVLQMAGNNMSLVNGALVAGAVDTGDAYQPIGLGGIGSVNYHNANWPSQQLSSWLGARPSQPASISSNGTVHPNVGIPQFDTLDTTGGTVDEFGLSSFFVDPPEVFDLYWGDTVDFTKVDLAGFDPPFTFAAGVYSAFRESFGGQYGFGLPITANPVWSTNVYAYALDQSNTYFNIVFVNTNFFDINGQLNTNITATVGFTDGIYIQGGRGGDPNGNQEIYVRFAMPVYDVVTGSTVTNAIYLADVGGILDTTAMDNNASSADDFGRPNPFSVTTTTPDAWPTCLGSDYQYTNALMYFPQTYLNEFVTPTVAAYGFQVGRNVETVDGSFTFTNLLSQLGSFRFNGLNLPHGVDYVVLPDPTNEGGRIDLKAGNLNLSNSRLRSEGMVLLNASNFVGQTAGSDWGEIDANLGATNGALVVSNVFPTNYQRLRGDIYAHCINWNNVFTNGATNTFHYHVLVIDQNLGGNFRSTIRNLNLSGSNSVSVADALTVINQSYFNTPSLTFNSNMIFTQNAGNLTPTNMPNLKYLFINTNGTVTVDSLLDVGYDVTKTQPSPANRKYSVLGVTNFGVLTAQEPLFQSLSFENDGTIIAQSNGSIIIDAAALGLGLAETNATNALLAQANVTLSAVAMGMINSRITNGYTPLGASTNTTIGVGLLTLQSTANGQITDFTSGAPSTNTPLVNFWQVTDGFSLPVKPATGDLFGTEIISVTTNFTVATHTWAGVDLGASSEGFQDNMVIGHLKLSRQTTNSVMHFTGAGVQNAMYVDYLELDTNSYSYSDYRDGMIIDPNLTIYFAACNVDPLKLETVYTNRLVWVPSFSGPNSTVAVPWTNVGNTNIMYCLMNTNVAYSRTISSSDSGVPNLLNEPYILNNPVTGIPAPCPGQVSTFKDFIIQNGTSITNGMTLQVAVKGGGSVSPSLKSLKSSQIALGKSYTFSAKASNGWTFSGWSTSGLQPGVNTASKTLHFTLQDTTAITAIFTPKTFTLVKGTYCGLFMDPNVTPTAGNSGWFTLSVDSTGAFSGKLLMGAASYNFSSKFLTNGFAQVNAKHGNDSIVAQFQLDMTGQSGKVTGYVISPAIALLGNLNPVWTAGNSSPYAGQYTIAMTNAGTNGGFGDSYGVVTVTKEGSLTAKGMLADGNPFTQIVPVSKDGAWPFYTYATKGHDRVMGWVDFANPDLFGATISTTNVYWSKTASAKASYYPQGFTNAFVLTGSGYVNPGKNASGLSLVDPVVILTGGGLEGSDMFPVSYDGKLSYSTNNLNLTVQPGQGIVSGRLETSGGIPEIKLQGVVLQNQGTAVGFFLGTNDESGAVLLESR